MPDERSCLAEDNLKLVRNVYFSFRNFAKEQANGKSAVYRVSLSYLQLFKRYHFEAIEIKYGEGLKVFNDHFHKVDDIKCDKLDLQFPIDREKYPLKIESKLLECLLAVKTDVFYVHDLNTPRPNL
uniref:Uncharacterized protein n=1 Tax=Ditylenchus dipsaci TaxID=166011 RepID=A0A915DA86_9BILA